jgi:hypothetical protein
LATEIPALTQAGVWQQIVAALKEAMKEVR